MGGILIQSWLKLLPLALIPSVAWAQGGELPTLQGLGLEYISRTGLLQVSFSGQLDLESVVVGADRWAGLVGHGGGDSIPSDWLIKCADCHGTEGVPQSGRGGHVNAHRLRVFADIFLGDHLYSLLEVRSDRGPAPANRSLQVGLEQAYVRAVADGGRLGVQMGRFASAFGAYPLRHLSVVDPFLRPPLPYDYRTVMHPSLAPLDVDDFLTWKNWPELFRQPGVPPVWDVPYQWGAMLFGGLGPVDLRLAALNSAPSSDPEAWGFDWARLRRPSWVVGARTKLSPSLEVGASYDRGPWMERIAVGAITATPGSPTPTAWDFEQEIISADFAYARGSLMIRGEAMLDFWEVPNVPGRPSERLYSLEAQSDVTPGLSVAARFGYIDFRPLERGGSRVDWEEDVYRVEGSVGYRLVRNAGVLLSGYRQSAGESRVTTLGGLRLWWAF